MENQNPFSDELEQAQPRVMQTEGSVSQTKFNFKYFLIALLVLLLVGGGALEFRQMNQKALSPTEVPVSPTVQPQTTDETAPSQVLITTPQANATVKSPLTVKGTVPPGWMFEGVAGIQLLDDKKQLIAQAEAREDTPGSWQSNEPVEFSGTVPFSTTAQIGYLVIMKDNPSGLPENDASFSIPVEF